MKFGIFGAYGEEAAVFGIVTDPDCCIGIVSSRVMVKPDGSFPEPLGLRLFVAGPDGPLGDAGRDKFRGVSVVEVLPDMADGMANGLLFGPPN